MMTVPIFTPIQIELRDRIADFVQGEGCHRIEYESEWLGWLPYGCYHWITCNGSDIDLSLSQDWSLDDLRVLEQTGFLEKISDSTDSNDNFCDKKIVYIVHLDLFS